MKNWREIVSALVIVIAGGGALAATSQVTNVQLLAALESPTGGVGLAAWGRSFTTLAFTNNGPTAVIISHVYVQTLGQNVLVTDGEMGVGVEPQHTVYLNFSNHRPEPVNAVYFNIRGSAGILRVYGLDRSGAFPSGFSAGN